MAKGVQWAEWCNIRLNDFKPHYQKNITIRTDTNIR